MRSSPVYNHLPVPNVQYPKMREPSSLFMSSYISVVKRLPTHGGESPLFLSGARPCLSFIIFDKVYVYRSDGAAARATAASKVIFHFSLGSRASTCRRFVLYCKRIKPYWIISLSLSLAVLCRSFIASSRCRIIGRDGRHQRGYYPSLMRRIIAPRFRKCWTFAPVSL